MVSSAVFPRNRRLRDCCPSTHQALSGEGTAVILARLRVNLLFALFFSVWLRVGVSVVSATGITVSPQVLQGDDPSLSPTDNFTKWMKTLVPLVLKKPQAVAKKPVDQTAAPEADATSPTKYVQESRSYA